MREVVKFNIGPDGVALATRYRRSSLHAKDNGYWNPGANNIGLLFIYNEGGGVIFDSCISNPEESMLALEFLSNSSVRTSIISVEQSFHFTHFTLSINIL
jgi:hypothetical protein